MKELLLKILAVAYVVGGVVSLFAYLPTIKDLIVGKKSANVLSYFLWTITTGLAFLYSLFILPDVFFIIVSGISFFSCAIIFILGLKNR